MERIYLISNPLTIPSDFKDTHPLSYKFYLLQRSLADVGIRLRFVKQDTNYVYVQAINMKTYRKSRIFTLSYDEIRKGNIPQLYRYIKEEL
ncbi:MAG: hypothetical protein KGY67_00505 [Candidatus Thermoplasmatota archaeon]|nr:hypothetical protein [Candidatus Thermoplasmatota archaeon]